MNDEETRSLEREFLEAPENETAWRAVVAARARVGSEVPEPVVEARFGWLASKAELIGASDALRTCVQKTIRDDDYCFAVVPPSSGETPDPEPSRYDVEQGLGPEMSGLAATLEKLDADTTIPSWMHTSVHETMRRRLGEAGVVNALGRAGVWFGVSYSPPGSGPPPKAGELRRLLANSARPYEPPKFFGEGQVKTAAPIFRREWDRDIELAPGGGVVGAAERGDEIIAFVLSPRELAAITTSKSRVDVGWLGLVVGSRPTASSACPLRVAETFARTRRRTFEP